MPFVIIINPRPYMITHHGTESVKAALRPDLVAIRRYCVIVVVEK